MFHVKKRKLTVIIPILVLLFVFSINGAAHDDLDYILYTVKQGDTLSSIAASYGVDIDTIAADNNIKDTSHIKAGDVLKIRKTSQSQVSASAPSGKSTSGTITMDIWDADIRDVLSTFAVTLKKNILYTEEPVNVSISVQNIPAMKALELLAQSVNMTCIEDRNIILVGNETTLRQNFYTMMPITRFDLQYIKPQEISSLIDKFAIPVQNVALNSSEQYIWAQGTPQALAKVRELVHVFDRAENIDLGMEEEQDEVKPLELIPLQLQYIEASVLNNLISQLDIPVKTVLIDVNPFKLWITGEESAVNDTLSLVTSVDIAENYVAKEDPGSSDEAADGSQESGAEEDLDETKEVKPDILEAKKMKNITASRLIPIVNGLDIPVKIVSIDSSGYSIWMKGDQDSIDYVSYIIGQLDTSYARDDVNYFIHKLTNLRATEAAARLNFINIENVRVFPMNFAQFSKELLVCCPADRINDVKNILTKLDVEGERIRVVVDSSTAASAPTRLAQRRDLIVSLTGIPKECFVISNNVSKTLDPYYVMWVEQTPSNIQLIMEVIKSIDNPGPSSKEGSSEE